MYSIIKRFSDIVISILLLIILSPLYIVISILIAVFLGRPVIFKQKRIGKDSKEFYIYKFKSMLDQNPDQNKTEEERLTNFGRFIRETSIDEFPQLINVLKGDMSIVGPRPLIREDFIGYEDKMSQRQRVLPGITGWAQINGRNELSNQEKFQKDLEYIENMSFRRDLYILYSTAKVVLSRTGIYKRQSNNKKPSKEVYTVAYLDYVEYNKK